MAFYLFYYESANYAGYGENYIVKGDTMREAENDAENAAEEFFYEQDVDQYLEENGEADDISWSSVVSSDDLIRAIEQDDFTAKILQNPETSVNSFNFINCTAEEVSELDFIRNFN